MATQRKVAKNTGNARGGNAPPKKGPWRGRFLDSLAETSNVSASALAAQKTTNEVYRERRKDPEFARQWLASLSEGYVHLELDVLRRLRDGDLQTEGGDKFDFANAPRRKRGHSRPLIGTFD